jgi:CO/xanthine dehydrogenase FAD-binding subunit
MIVEYHRPENLEEALVLLARTDPPTFPLGGGTVLSRYQKADFAVVDLQRLGLNQIQLDGQLCRIGAAVTLQQLFEYDEFPEAMRSSLRESLLLESSANLRRMATVGGTIVSCDGRSPFVTALLALDPRLVWAEGSSPASLGDYLPLRGEFKQTRLLTEIRLPLNTTLKVDSVGRAPLDRPLVYAAAASWPSGRTRVTLGGFGKAPVLAMDGPEPGGASVAAREAYRFAEDEWASAAYRMEAAGRMVQRMVKAGER